MARLLKGVLCANVLKDTLQIKDCTCCYLSLLSHGPMSVWTSSWVYRIHKRGMIRFLSLSSNSQKCLTLVRVKNDRCNACRTIILLQIYRLYGLPLSIVSDRISRFLSHFWRLLWKLLRTSLYMSTAYHPQFDGQTEVVNRSLGDMLHCLAGDNIKTLDNVL